MTHAAPHHIFKIPEDEFFEILHQDIIPRVVGNVTAQKGKATAIIIGGQPGSGKTTLQQKALEQLQYNAVICDIDVLRYFHPNIYLLKKEYPDSFNEHTYTYAHRWNAEVIKYCCRNNLNFIMETTFTDGEWLNEFIDQVKGYPDNMKYRVEIMLLAVNPKESLLGIKLRYESQKSQSEVNFGRDVPKEIHDLKFSQIPDALAALIREKKYDALHIYVLIAEEINSKFVYRAENVPLIANEDVVTLYRQITSAPLAGNNLRAYKQTLSEVYTNLINRNATPAEMAEFFITFDPDIVL